MLISLTRLPPRPDEEKYAKTSKENTVGIPFLMTSLADPLVPTVMLPDMGLISKTPSSPWGRSIPYRTVSVTGALARNTITSLPENINQGQDASILCASDTFEVLI